MEINIPDSLWKAVALLTGSGLISLLIFVVKRYADRLDQNLQEFRMNIESLNVNAAVSKERLDTTEERLDKHEAILNGKPKVKYRP